MLAGSHRNAWPDETGTGGRTNRNTHHLARPSRKYPPLDLQGSYTYYFSHLHIMYPLSLLSRSLASMFQRDIIPFCRYL